jgi:hypothetical protein
LVPTDYEDAIARDTVTGRRSTAAESRASTLEGLIGRLERAWPPVDTSVGAWLASHGWSASRLDGWAEAVEITQEYGVDPRRLGVRATQEGADYRGGDAMVAGGYVAIVDDLLAVSDLRLSSAVESVSARGPRVEVALSSGARVTADIAVVAVPLALVRAGRPKLPDMTGGVRGALRQIVTGNLEKVVLRYDDQWWGDHQVYGIVGGGAPGAPAGTPASLRWTEFYSLTDVLGFPALVGFSGGSAARTRPASDSGCVREATAALGAAFAG